MQRKKEFRVLPCICTFAKPEECRVKVWEDKYTEKFHCEEFYRDHPDAEREGFYGMPVIGVYQGSWIDEKGQKHYGQTFSYECPRCGRGGLLISGDYKNAWAALRDWNELQRTLWRIKDYGQNNTD